MIGEQRAIVIDGGSETIRAGFAGETSPRYQISEDNLLVKKHPIENGVITGWGDMETILQHAFTNELKVDQSHHSLLYIENPLIDANREKMTEIIFEKFNIQSFYVGISSVMSLYSSGQMNGVIVECGHDQTSFVPVINGYPIKRSMKKTNVAGRSLTTWMSKIRSCDLKHGRTMKEKEAFMTIDKDTDDFNGFVCSELLFNPRMNGYEVEGIDSILISAINECEEKNRNRLLSNVVTTGGTTKIRGFDDRIQHELSKSTNDEVKVISTQDRQLSSWIGGSIFSSLEQFKHISISCYDYKESGPSVSLKKCV